MYSCQRDTEPPSEQSLNNDNLTLRSHECGPPEEGCDETETKTLSIEYEDCRVSVQLDITVCYDALGNPEVYFEEVGVEINIHSLGCVINDPDWIENVYAAAVEFWMLSDSRDETFTLPLCSQDQTGISAFHIQTSCAANCPTNEGENIFFTWVECGVTSCCIVETQYCINAEGEKETLGTSSKSVGGCDLGPDASVMPACYLETPWGSRPIYCTQERCPF